MVLMRIAMPVREDDIWLNKRLQFFKKVLHPTAIVRQITIADLLENDISLTARHKPLGRLLRFELSNSHRTEDYPAEFRFHASPAQLEYRCTAANFNVVGMRAQAQNRQRFVTLFCPPELNHAVSLVGTPFFQTNHG